MEFWLFVWIFYVVFNVFTCVFINYLIIKSGLNYRYSVPVLVAAIVILSVFWPVTWLAILYGKGKKDHKEDEENGDY